MHQLSKSLTTRFAVVALEDLNVAGMVRAPKAKPDPANPGVFLPNGRSSSRARARGISDASLSRLHSQIAYKADLYGSRVHVIDRFEPSSRVCSVCQAYNHELGSSETFRCPECGVTLDRDLNAAVNIARIALTGQTHVGARNESKNKATLPATSGGPGLKTGKLAEPVSVPGSQLSASSSQAPASKREDSLVSAGEPPGRSDSAPFRPV